MKHTITKTERKAANAVNSKLAELGRTYHDGLPIDQIAEIPNAAGFNGSAMDGIYTGRDGRMHEQVSDRAYISMTWYKMPVTGRFEVVAYVS